MRRPAFVAPPRSGGGLHAPAILPPPCPPSYVRACVRACVHCPPGDPPSPASPELLGGRRARLRGVHEPAHTLAHVNARSSGSRPFAPTYISPLRTAAPRAACAQHRRRHQAEPSCGTSPANVMLSRPGSTKVLPASFQSVLSRRVRQRESPPAAGTR